MLWRQDEQAMLLGRKNECSYHTPKKKGYPCADQGSGALLLAKNLASSSKNA